MTVSGKAADIVKNMLEYSVKTKGTRVNIAMALQNGWQTRFI